MESLRISQRLAECLNSAVDIAHIDIDFLDFLAVDRSAETKHTVSRRMLRTDVDNKVAGVEHLNFFLLDSAVRKLDIVLSQIALALVFD